MRAFYEAFTGSVTFLTARPSDRGGLVEDDITFPMLDKRGVCDATVLGIDVTGGTDPSTFFVNPKMARAKGVNFERFLQLYPEYGVAFVGDSGQGDLAAGRGMRETAPGATRAVFIHDLAVDGTTTSPAERAELAARRVYMFDSYVDAARQAFDLGLITADALRKVMTAAATELRAIKFADQVSFERNGVSRFGGAPLTVFPR